MEPRNGFQHSRVFGRRLRLSNLDNSTRKSEFKRFLFLFQKINGVFFLKLNRNGFLFFCLKFVLKICVKLCVKSKVCNTLNLLLSLHPILLLKFIEKFNKI